VNVGLAIDRSARRYPDRAAVFDRDRTVTYRELDERTNRLANLLAGGFGVRPGERVALLAHNRAEVIEVLGGVAKAGGVYVGLNFRLTEDELRWILGNAEPAAIVTEAEFADLAGTLGAERGIPVLDLDSRAHAEALAASRPDPPVTLHRVRHTDDFCIVYTSGTTGLPKGILFDHAAAIQHGTVACLEYGIRHDTRYLIQIPHNSSVNITMVPCLMIGAAVGFTDHRGFDGERFVAEVRQRGVTHSFLVPTQLIRVLDQLPGGAELPTLETVGYGSSPIPPDRLGELLDRFGPIFNQLYGMAEIASIGTILRKEDHVRALGGEPRLLASCGQPSYAVDVRVVDEDGRDVEVGQRGEVIFGGPHLMKGYYQDPERTAETLRDGWVHSGDVAEVDGEGYLYVVDRIKNLIIRGGQNIAPTEVENVLSRHPAVLESAVIGVPDPEWGEAVLAVVVRRKGADADDAELIDHCRRSGLGSIKVPERVEFVDALPKNAVGKTAKTELRSSYWTGSRSV
jgi:fatty-acyl-CoA synthase/long-chain acyl-CoA synthetase